MKTFIVFAAIIAVAIADRRREPNLQVHHHGSPADHKQIVLIKETPSNNIGLDNYQYGYKLSDGQTREESAHVETRHNGKEDVSVLRVTGSYSFVADDGLTYTVHYVADENGFQPQGAHLPVAPVV